MKRSIRGARQIAAFFLRQGGIYVKAAQYLSTVSNLFEEEFSDIFASIPDVREPQQYETVRYRFLAEFGAEPEELYQEFDRTPLAAASLGQVHVARIRDGRKVAVKFLHAGIEDQIRRDLRALRYAVNLILWFYPDLDFRSHLNEFSNMLLSEIDYENEAENVRRAREIFRDEERIAVPEVIAEFSGSAVLTVEFLEGTPINDLEALDSQGTDRKVVAELLLEAYARMILDERFYHADPHPGNIFVLPEDPLYPVRLGFVDFGAAQHITERTFNLLRRYIDVLGMRDIQAFVEVAQETGILNREADPEPYINLIEFVYSRYSSFKMDEFYRINPVRFGRMIKVRDLTAAGLKIRQVIRDVKPPRKYIYLGRTVTMLISLAMRLDSQVNVFMVAKPHIEAYVQPRSRGLLDYLKTRSWINLAERALGSARPAAVQGPSPPPSSDRSRLYYRLGQQAILALLGISVSFLGAYLNSQGETQAARLAVWGAGFCFLWLFWKMNRSTRV